MTATSTSTAAPFGATIRQQATRLAADPDAATDDGDDTIGDGIVFPPGDLDHPPLHTTLDGLDTPDRPR